MSLAEYFTPPSLDSALRRAASTISKTAAQLPDLFFETAREQKPLFLSRSVPNPSYAVDIQKGFKSSIYGWQPLLDSPFFAPHAHVELMGHESPGSRLKVMDSYRSLTQARFFSEHPPQTQSLKHFAVAHSMGAFLILEGLMDDEFAEQFVKNYVGFSMSNMFLGDPYHDKRAYRFYSQTFRWAAAGGTMLEQLINGSIDAETRKSYPTHPQSLLLHKEAEKFLQRLRANGGLSKHARKLPMIIFIGDHDPSCNNDYIREAAGIIGIEVVSFPTGHSTILESTEAQKALTDWQDDIAGITPHADLSSHHGASL